MKVLVVDDEIKIREGVCAMLQDCEQAGIRIEVVGSAADGKSALNLLNNCEADLLITDVRMPGMDGLQLLEKARMRYPDMQTVILSGYDDFAYVQQALRLGAADYLLKPIQKQEFTAMLSRLLELRTKEKKETFLGWPEFNVLDGFKAVIAADPDNLDNARAREFGDEQTVAWILRKASMELLEETEGVYFLGEQNKPDPCNILYGLIASSSEAASQQARRFADRLSAFWTGKMRLPISFGISRPFLKEQAEGTPYREALTALLARLPHGSGVYFADPGPNAALSSRTESDPLQQIRASLDVRDYDRVSDTVLGIARRGMETMSPAETVQTLEKIIFTLHHWALAAAPGRIQANGHQTADFAARLLWSRSTGDLLQAVEQWMHDFFLLIDPDQQEGQIMSRAKKYIRDHLQEPITLEQLGKITFTSKSYLSRLFRKRTGQTFIEYLTDIRMEKAKKLLAEPGIKIYEVAEQLGYQDWKHFSRTFKDRTGYGPAEYRSKLQINDSE
ncbi:response regulator [Paenibacillus agaridevorans]|nr:response regulator [Paenibacillus agaridevorans]